MPEISVGPVAAAGIVNEVSAACPLLGGLNVQIQNFESRLANALETAADEIVEEKKAEAKIAAHETDGADGPEPDVMVTDDVQPAVTGSASSSGDRPSGDDPIARDLAASAERRNPGDPVPADAVMPDRDKAVETGAANLQAEEQVQSRVSQVIGQYRDEFVRRAADLDLLSNEELSAFAKSLIEDQPLEQAWETQQNSLRQQANDARDLLERLAKELEGSAAACALADHITTNVVNMVSAADADPMAIDFLACEHVKTVSQLIASVDQDPGAQRAATFDAHLAVAYAERLLKDQVSEAFGAVKSDLAQLSERSAARQTCEAFVAIAEALPEAGAETRQAVEQYYATLAEKRGHPAARDLLDRLLTSRDEVLLDHLVHSGYDSRVAQALSADEEVSARARRQIEQADSDDVRARPARRAPVDEIPPDTTAAFHLLKTDVFEVVRNEIVKMDSLVEAITLHAEARLRNALTVLELVDTLKQQGVIERGTPVVVGGALFQLGKGSREDDTEAAHKLAGQVYIGVDQATLATLDEEQRRPYRLDTLLQGDAELEMLARIQAASTSVLPSCVNKVDSLCESKEFRDAFEQAVAQLVDQDNWNHAAVAQAYETFRAGAISALEDARTHVAAQLDAERAAADRAAESLRSAQLQRREEVIAAYDIVMRQTDADRAHALMQDWLAMAQARNNDR